MHLAADLYIDLIEVPFPPAEALHPADPLAANVSSEQPPEPVPPETYRRVADVDTSLGQQIFNVPQAQREADVHHHHQSRASCI